MGCCSSTDSVVHPLTAEQVNGDEDDRGSKVRNCGDSAVSKGTTDSGVVVDKEIPMLPGEVPRKLPPLTSTWAKEIGPGFLQQETTVHDRQKSSDILEDLLNQGIIPVGQTKEKGSRAGEAYSIMVGTGSILGKGGDRLMSLLTTTDQQLNDTEAVRRRPPARLESLKAKKEQTLPSKEEIEEKIKLAEERRKLKEDELKTRLRAKSARVRILTSRTEEDGNYVEQLESALSSDLLQDACGAANVQDCLREAAGEGCEKNMSEADETEVTEMGEGQGSE